MTSTSCKAETPAFIKQQYAFAAHIRNPEVNPGPEGIEDRRMAIYRELFYNNVEGFLANTFPVLKSLFDETTWHGMARDFYSTHQSHTPLFLEIPREFLAYLENERGQYDSDPAFLYELAHYEWTELALSVAETSEKNGYQTDADLLETRPVLSSVAWPFVYNYPVHRISPEFQPEQPGEKPTYLLVYRDHEDEVGFIELNDVSARLFSLLQETAKTSGRSVLKTIAEELQHPDPEVVINSGLDILEEWRTRGIVLGGVPIT
jgi:hypothetical protein